MDHPFRLALVAMVGVCLSTVCPAAPGSTESGAKKASPTSTSTPNKLFHAADADSDGKVSWAELHARLPKFPKARFQRFDKDSDGFLIESELPRRKRPAANSVDSGVDNSELIRYVKGLVKKHDANGDNELTLAELQKGKPGFPTSTFTALDRDRNGVLNSKDGEQPGKKQNESANREKRSTLRGAPPLRKHDTNEDGKISFEEAKTAYPNLNQERFDRRDRNGDGFWSPQDRKER